MPGVLKMVSQVGGGGGGGGGEDKRDEAWSGYVAISCHLLYLVSQMYPKHSYRDAFNKVLPDMKKSIIGSVDGLCDKAISEKLMTHEEKAGILVDNNEHKQASRFLDSLAPKIEVDPEVLALLMNMLTGLHLGTCDKIVCKWFLLLGVGPIII